MLEHNKEKELKYVETNLRLKQEKTNLKRSIRRRVEKVRNLPSSDMESDTGSDGLAVNSEGSGRSGDWGPPKVRRRSKCYRKRQENRMSLTDSGISLSKTDLESLSGLSINTHSTPEYRQLNSYQKILNGAYARQHLKQSDTTEDSSLDHKQLKYPPLVCKQNVNNDNQVDSTNNNGNERRLTRDIESFSRVARNIEAKEHEILEQCIKNEKLMNGDSRNFIVDCSDAIPDRQSRFPLPDHLNYPICRYRIKPDSANRSHPLQKLKDGWKKLKSKKLFGDKRDTSADTDCYPEFYPDFVTPNKEDDNEAILSRLSRNPNQRKNFARRVFNRFGSKSYSINCNINITEHERIPRMPRSGSTRSVPDALQDMWSKAHFSEDAPCEPSNGRGLHKVISMPSIHTQSETHKDHSNFFNQIVNHTTNNLHQSEKTLNTGKDIADRLSGLQITSQDTNCVDKSDRKVCFDENNATHYNENGGQPGESLDADNISNSLMKSPRKFASCHELYQRPNTDQNKKYIPPQMYYQPTCACCIGAQPVQFVPFYPYPNYMYQVPPYGPYPPMDYVPNFYPMNGGYYAQTNNQSYHMMNGGGAHARVPVDNVVPPLNVKMEEEKVAEKRKISEMVFDTFV